MKENIFLQNIKKVQSRNRELNALADLRRFVKGELSSLSKKNLSVPIHFVQL